MTILQALLSRPLPGTVILAGSGVRACPPPLQGMAGTCATHLHYSLSYLMPYFALFLLGLRRGGNQPFPPLGRTSPALG